MHHMGGKVEPAEKRIAWIASRAHGVVTREELIAAGVTSREIDRRVERGALIRRYRGVYRVGHYAASMAAEYVAAVKACGPGALLCGKAAAFLLGLLRTRTPPPPEVMTPTYRKVTGLKTRRTRSPNPRDGTKVKGIPVTTVALTLVQLAAELDDEDLARCCHEAGVKYRTTPRQVEAVLRRRPNSSGARKLRLIASGDTKALLSVLEKGLHDSLAEWDLPLPDDTNKLVDERRVDCRWRDQKLTVELNGFRFHNSHYSWEQANERQREAYARGDEFRTYTYKDVFEDRRRMWAELEKLLS
jgi:hypothetical protein